jgi:hypothetical protein
LRGAGQRRGQATVELALGLLVFVTVLLFGIHFAEVGWLSLKVQEAGAWAVWESTGLKTQNIAARDLVPFNQTVAPGGLGVTTTNRYQDFNGLSSVTGSPFIGGALVKGSSLTATCQADATLKFAPTRTVDAAGGRGPYFDEGGLSCQVVARLDGIRIPSAFVQNSADGFFKADHNNPAPYFFCAVGGRSGGNCRGRLSILTNDWGFAGDAESSGCRIGNPCTNTTYRDAVSAMWTGGGNAGKAFAEAHAGAAPTSAMDFYFSYAGVEFDYVTNLGDEGGNTQYKTGGPGLGDLPMKTLHNCFLGKAGCE